MKKKYENPLVETVFFKGNVILTSNLDDIETPWSWSMGGEVEE